MFNRSRIVFIALLATALAGYAEAGTVSIKGTKKSEGSRDGGKIVGARKVKVTNHDVYYQFDLRSMAPAEQKDMRVQWVILVNTFKGQIRTASQGAQTVTLLPGKVEEVTTPVFVLHEERSGPGNSRDGDILGYAVRVYDSTGALAGELYEPESERKRLSDEFH